MPPAEARRPVARALPGPTEPPVPAPDVAPRQRWRLCVRMPALHLASDLPNAPGAWAAIVDRAGLPLAGTGGARGRVTPAGQLPLGVAGEREIVDVYLRRRLTRAAVRAAVEAVLPAPIVLVDLHDVWVGAPAAPAAVTAADYLIQVAGCDVPGMQAAADALLRAAALPRTRRREKKASDYDFRPLIVRLSAEAPPSDAPARCGAAVRARLRHGPDGIGRPDELIAALGEPPAPPFPVALDAILIVRERLILGDDPED